MQVSTPKLSVIIPTYNVEDYVQEAVDSVLRQTAPVHEIIIVDDGSTDGSGRLVDRLYGDVPNVRILHTRNCGLGGARNNGVAVATGDFIYYLDSDDVLDPDFVRCFYDVHSRHPGIDLFCFSTFSFTGPAETAANSVEVRYNLGLEGPFPSGEDAFNALCRRRRFFPMAWMYVHRRSVSRDNGIEFLPILHEDVEYTPRLFMKAGLTYLSSRDFYLWRIRQNSISFSRLTERHVIGYVRSMEAVQGLIDAPGLKPETYRNLRRYKTRLLGIAMGLVRSGDFPLDHPELHTVPEMARRLAWTDPKLFLVTHCFPAFQAAKAAKRMLRQARRSA
ncbi:glycosyltransferase [Mycobacterium sp. KBS0706]|uniref:glycosyltransferase family 2 protein n=1 Tax=Mycobacterium sp. KBS0706 TaxID=2578109 RepID=UPI00110FB965|nr:glycosyltransferase [Mycobacterium sp. KBS0706]TSD86206.1 glycosyltransferase [Mycobacterium sp. KBS0706]